MTAAPPPVELCALCAAETDAPVAVGFTAQVSGPGWVTYADPRCVRLFRIIPLADQADDDQFGSLQYRPALP